jgi:two-component system response regulator MprA
MLAPPRSALILLVEDRPEMLALLTRTLSSEGYAVASAADAAGGIATIFDRKPSLVVLDVGLPDRNGFEVVRDLRQRGFVGPVLMLTARDSVADKVAGLEAGADDYLAKPFDPDELTARVHALLRRAQRGGAETQLELGALRVDLIAREVTWSGMDIALTQREFELLVFLMRNAGRQLSRDEISRAVWGREATGAPNIVGVYVSYLRKKLDDAGAPPLLETAAGGYVLQREARPDGGKRRAREP